MIEKQKKDWFTAQMPEKARARSEPESELGECNPGQSPEGSLLCVRVCGRRNRRNELVSNPATEMDPQVTI